jgi:hypothetical protein
MKNIYTLKRVFIASISAMLLLYIMFSGSDCSEVTNEPSVPDAIQGNWKLVLQTGALQDICPDEIVNFQSSGIAILTCPGSEAISRDYTVSNDILTYTETSIAYDIVFSNNQQTLELKGRNVSRNLTYSKQSAALPDQISGSGNYTTSADTPKEVSR